MLAWIAFALAPINASAQDAPALSQRIAIYNPQWSPDGRTILFESNIDGAFGVYTIARDGTGLRRLTDPSFVAEQPTWSPDGASIVYSRRPNIHVMKADGSDDRPILSMPGGAYYQSSFSPDGRFIAFQGTRDPASTRDRVFVMRADGSDLRVLSDSAYGAEGPTWTSDGRITYQRVPYPKPYWPEMGPADMASARAETRLMSIRPDGSGLSEVPTPPEPARPAGVPAEASVTHDGRDFAFTRDSSGWSCQHRLKLHTFTG
jgi:dipeptidyl aminopeptidase/acylaminoacyl peptidase